MADGPHQRHAPCCQQLRCMAISMRRPRLELSDIPMHLTHRGVNRAATFLDEDDRAGYLQALAKAASDQRVMLHAYVLMTNHVHLLVSTLVPGAVSRMMQAVGRRYVRPFNARHGRTGTLWEGRYKSCLIDSDRYLLACIRYIELNPVRAGMVVAPWDYRWSSVHAHLGLLADPRWHPHATYLGLGPDAVARASNYRALLMETLDQAELAAIRDYLRQERALGSPRFHAMIEKTLNRPATMRLPGRPTRAREQNSNGNVL